MPVSNNGPLTLEAAAAIPKGALVTLSAGKAALCAANSTVYLGAAMTDVASGGDVPISLAGAGGICQVLASEAISAGDKITFAASGKAQVIDTGELCIGQAITAASADGALFTAKLYERAIA